MVLSDTDIQAHIASGDIRISNFSGVLQPASYDLRVGDEAVTEAGIVNVAQNKLVKISRGATAIVYPKERIALSTKLAARYGLRSSLARRGLILLSGPQIDPGFEGLLAITVFNAGTADIVLTHGQECATLEFFLLTSPASRPYEGPYQGQSGVTEAEAEVVTRKYRNLTEIEEILSDLQAGARWTTSFVRTVLFGLVAGIVGGLVVLAFQRLLN